MNYTRFFSCKNAIQKEMLLLKHFSIIFLHKVEVLGKPTNIPIPISFIVKRVHRNMFQACNEEVTEGSMGTVIYVLQTRSLLEWRKNRITSNSNCALLTSCLATSCYRSNSYACCQNQSKRKKY